MKARRALQGLSALGVAILFVFSGVPRASAARTVKVGLFPFGPGGMVARYIADAGIVKKWGAKVGADFTISHPRDDFAAFLERSIDIVSLSTLEVARLVGDGGRDIIMWGRQVDASIDMYVRSGSAYKGPGDLKGKKIVHPGWDTGPAQMGIVLLKEWYGLDLRKDFTVVTAPWTVGPRLLAEGDVEMSLNLMPLTLELWRTKKIRPVLATYATEWSKRRNTEHHLSIGNFTSRGKWLGGNQRAARAWLGAFTEGMEYARKNTEKWAYRYRDLIKKDATDAQVDFYVKWLNRYTVVYKDAYIDRNFIDEETAFLKMALDAGFVKSGGLSPKIWKILKPLM